MRLKRLCVSNMRNIAEAEFFADESLTIISGQNAQGKTNILECIWLLTGSKSFRGAKDYELVQENCDFGKILGETKTDIKQNNIEIVTCGQNSGKRGRKAKINGVPYARATEIAGVFTSVVFDPGHLFLVKGGPEVRRKFIDAALCQLYPSFISTVRRFTRAVSQKNALLKKYYETPNAEEMMDVFDAEMSQSGEEISKRRRIYIELLSPFAEQTYLEIASGKEKMRLVFASCCKEGEMLDLLKKSRQKDIRAGFCTVGPHKEDFETFINKKSARNFGSQGQQRSAALSFKLAEAACTKEILGEHPVMLLDDVLSELDETRQAYLLGKIKGKQTFVTTCEPDAFRRTVGKILRIENGKII